ncbi:MAG TPA: SRPBCC family protein [Acidimicrobiales bacterium]|nr:SRPBCC family protein [Acidimicrobiales bacterium]
MSDQATQQMHIEAPLERIWDVLTDFETYPRWARDLKEATVLQRDEEGRALLVRFRAAAMGRSTTYTLAYDWDDAPNRLPWKLVSGDIQRVLDGAYEFIETDSGTDVTYHLRVDLAIPLPGFVKRRAEARIISTALRELRDHVTEPV